MKVWSASSNLVPRCSLGTELLRSLFLVGTLATSNAHAALFGDDEARAAIVDLRKRLDESSQSQRASQAELADQVNQLRRSLLDLNSQIEVLRAENARLRGQDEQLQRDVSEVQRKQRDVEQGVEERIRRVEPQKVSVDGQEFLASPEEKRAFDASMDLVRRADFAAAAQDFASFLRRYPSSGYAATAQFWLGNALYGKRDYKEAMVAFRSLIAGSPESPRVPEALLSIANCQAELKDVKAARKTLDDLIKAHPKSEAAQAAKERLVTLK